MTHVSKDGSKRLFVFRAEKVSFGKVKWQFTWYHVANPNGSIELHAACGRLLERPNNRTFLIQTAPYADKGDRGVYGTRPVMMMSCISSCRNKTVS